MIKELSNEDFFEEIKEGLVLVDFFATWCGPCQRMAPIMEDLSKEIKNVKIIKVDVDEHEEIARKYGIMSIPTIILFHNGEIEKKQIGFVPAEILKQWFK